MSRGSIDARTEAAHWCHYRHDTYRTLQRDLAYGLWAKGIGQWAISCAHCPVRRAHRLKARSRRRPRDVCRAYSGANVVTLSLSQMLFFYAPGALAPARHG